MFVLQTSQPQTTKNLEIKVKTREIWEKTFEIYRRPEKELKAVSVYHRFPPFWQSGQNVSRRDKLVTITLFGICLLNMVRSSVSCQTVHQIWQICLRTVHLYSIGAKKSIYKAKIKIFKGDVFHRLVNLLTVRFLCLIVRPWDCPKNRETSEVLGLFLGSPENFSGPES